MKILIIGGNGTIGKRLCESFSKNHHIITAGRSSGDIQVDMGNPASLEEMFQNIGTVDAIICAAGETKWDLFDNLSEDDFYAGIKSKLMGQINLVKIGKNYLSASSSITLTTGVLADDPVKMTTIAAMVNGGIHSFVLALGMETGRKYRINVVSAEVVEDAYEKYKDYFPGHKPVAMDKVVEAYRRAIEGDLDGEVIRVYD